MTCLTLTSQTLQHIHIHTACTYDLHNTCDQPTPPSYTNLHTTGTELSNGHDSESLSSSIWASVSKPHSSAFDVTVESCLCGMYTFTSARMSQLVWSAQLVTCIAHLVTCIAHLVTCIAHRYWHDMCLLSCRTSNSETLFERRQWRERETIANETWDERATTLCHLCVATSHTLTPHCSTFT